MNSTHKSTTKTQAQVELANEIVKLEKKVATYYAWLNANVDSKLFADVCTEWNNTKFKLATARERYATRNSDVQVMAVDSYKIPLKTR